MTVGVSCSTRGRLLPPVPARGQEPVTRRVYVTRGEPYHGEIIPSVTLRTIYVYPRLRFKDSKEYVAYLRLVRDVKRVLPVANMINRFIVETYEYAETLPTDRERKRHMQKINPERFRKVTDCFMR